jgi:hypothetical protein
MAGMTEEQARHFAEVWMSAWNSHDLDAILNHYAPDVEFVSPFVQKLFGDSSGTVRGRERLKGYFRNGLQAYPLLRFELRRVLIGVGSITLYYLSVNGLLAAETMVFDRAGLVREVRVHYCKA